MCRTLRLGEAKSVFLVNCRAGIIYQKFRYKSLYISPLLLLMKTVRARGVKGRRGDVVLELPGGKIGLPRGFIPREWEWYDVEIIEDRGNYAFVRLHHHRPTFYGICSICGAVIHHQYFTAFATRWLNNMLLKRHEEVTETAKLVIKRLDVLIDDLEDMIKRLYVSTLLEILGECDIIVVSPVELSVSTLLEILGLVCLVVVGF